MHELRSEWFGDWLRVLEYGDLIRLARLSERGLRCKHPRLEIGFQVRCAYDYQRLVHGGYTIPIIHLSSLSYNPVNNFTSTGTYHHSKSHRPVLYP